jgi:tetraacyldisaccharide 4'-kinase
LRTRWRPSPLLAPLGWIWSGVARTRNRMFDAGWLRVERAGVPVISVGNLTAGGTGKTPLVHWLVAELQAAGKRPGVLSRGYGRLPGEALNDEGRMLAAAFPGLPQVQEPDRVRGAHELVAGSRADVIVMDDGFQHRRLSRDLDVVCLDATSPFGGGQCLPAGLLREPVAGLARAGAIVLTRAEGLGAAGERPLVALLRELAPRATIHKATHAPHDVVRRPDGASAAPGTLRGRAVWLLSGIANPDSFEETVLRLGARVAGHDRFPDHHPFTGPELGDAAERAGRAAAELLTTEKDDVRMPQGRSPRLVLRIRLRFLSEPLPVGQVVNPS